MHTINPDQVGLDITRRDAVFQGDDILALDVDGRYGANLIAGRVGNRSGDRSGDGVEGKQGPEEEDGEVLEVDHCAIFGTAGDQTTRDLAKMCVPDALKTSRPRHQTLHVLAL